MLAAPNDKKFIGLFSKTSHLDYDLDRIALGNASTQPSLAEMTTKAMDMLANNPKNPKGYFLMVEGGRIDHALHSTIAQKALQDTVAFDNAIRAAIDKVKLTDPTLAHTLIVVTADHDHTLVLNGYAKRLGKTTTKEPGVLGMVKNYNKVGTKLNGDLTLDADGMPYTIIGFGNGESRTAGARSTAAALTDAQITAALYHQEAVVQSTAGGETHGGTDVFLGAIGMGAGNFHGTIENNQVFNLIRTATGW
jgi:alkaline phosphatase